MDRSIVVVAITTYYPKWYRGKLRSIKHTDKIRGDLALDLVNIAKEKGYNVVVAEGKSSKSFRRELLKIDGIKAIMRRSVGFSSARREVIKRASKVTGAKVILLTEPEKVSLIKDCADLIVAPILNGEADIVVPKREENLFKNTYPKYQYESEIEANKLYNGNLRAYKLLSPNSSDLDMFMGPKALLNNKKIVSLFMKKFAFASEEISLFGPEGYSNTLFFPVVKALKKKLRVLSVTIPFSYPLKQRENEEKGEKALFLEKRKNQKLSILIELSHFLLYLDRKPGSKLKLVRCR